MMRQFDQRRELQQNLSNLEVIFDQEKQTLYNIIVKSVHELTKLIEQTEDWLEEFFNNNNTYEYYEPVKRVAFIFKNLKNCFYEDVVLDLANLTITPIDSSDHLSNRKIDSNK